MTFYELLLLNEQRTMFLLHISISYITGNSHKKIEKKCYVKSYFQGITLRLADSVGMTSNVDFLISCILFSKECLLLFQVVIECVSQTLS